jgi:hypothetical protein
MASASVPETPGATYQWSIQNGAIIGSSTGRIINYRASCAGSVSLSVAVTAGCTANGSRSVTIFELTAIAGVSPSSIPQGGSATLTAVYTGQGPWTVVWSDGMTQTNVTTDWASRSASPLVTTVYTATVTDAFGCSRTSLGVTLTVTAPPPAPTLTHATGASQNSVLIEWTYSGTADRFDIERFDKHVGSPPDFRVVGSTPSGSDRSWTDSGLPVNTACLYRIRAVKAGTPSNPSAVDVGSTFVFTDPNLGAGTVVKAAHITDLRFAVNLLRLLANQQSYPFTDPSLAGVRVDNAHIEELRTALDQARQSLGLTPWTYNDRPLNPGTLIRAVHFNDLRGGVR